MNFSIFTGLQQYNLSTTNACDLFWAGQSMCFKYRIKEKFWGFIFTYEINTIFYFIGKKFFFFYFPFMIFTYIEESDVSLRNLYHLQTILSFILARNSQTDFIHVQKYNFIQIIMIPREIFKREYFFLFPTKVIRNYNTFNKSTLC